MSFDRLARPYRLLETLAFGNALQRARTFWIDKIPSPKRALIVGEGNGRFLCELLCTYPKIDVVHVSHKSSDGDQAHMHRQKAEVTNQQNKMDGSRSLPAPEELWEKREPIINRRGHRYPG